MTRKRLIDEREVARAVREGSGSLDATGAVVTPSARDAAARAGIELRGLAAKTVPKANAGTNARSSGAAASPAKEPPRTLRVAVGADHGGVALKDAIAQHLRDQGHHVTDLGTNSSDAVDYPDFAVAVARAVTEGRAQFGIMVDGAGIGSCMAANKVRGARAAMCYDRTTAANAREHNGANVLTLGGGLIGRRLALEIVDTFLTTPFGGDRHAKRVAKIDALDGRSPG